MTLKKVRLGFLLKPKDENLFELSLPSQARLSAAETRHERAAEIEPTSIREMNRVLNENWNLRYTKLDVSLEMGWNPEAPSLRSSKNAKNNNKSKWHTQHQSTVWPVPYACAQPRQGDSCFGLAVAVRMRKVLARPHSRPQSPRSFLPVAGIESSGLV